MPGQYIELYASQTTNEAANQTTISATMRLFSNGWSFGDSDCFYTIYIGDQAFSGVGPRSLYSPNNWDVTHTRTFTHNDNGYRPAIATVAQFAGTGPYMPSSLSANGPTLPAVDYDRKPAAPSTVTPVLNADKSISVTSNVVSSPAGTATYLVGYSSDGGSTWSSDITIGGNARTYTFTPGSLTYGLTYKFRMKASNTDGTSGYTSTTVDTFLPAGGRRFDGSTFNPTTIAMRHNGTDFVTLTIAKRHNGTTWADLT